MIRVSECMKNLDKTHLAAFQLISMRLPMRLLFIGINVEKYFNYFESHFNIIVYQIFNTNSPDAPDIFWRSNCGANFLNATATPTEIRKQLLNEELRHLYVCWTHHDICQETHNLQMTDCISVHHWVHFVSFASFLNNYVLKFYLIVTFYCFFLQTYFLRLCDDKLISFLEANFRLKITNRKNSWFILIKKKIIEVKKKRVTSTSESHFD